MSSSNMHTVGQVLFYVVWAAVMVDVVNQVKKPSRWIGRPFLWLMNMSHSTLTDWGLSHVDIEESFTILDMGCGGGRTIEKLAAIAAGGMVYAVDYAEGSIAVSRAKNAQLIEAGRVKIRQASVSDLPFPEDKFDLVTAVETQYYWPDLMNDMREILRVLRPGGKLVVIAESYKKGTYNAVQRPVMKLLKTSNLGVDDHRELFSNAGFTDIKMFEERAKGWICGVGRKPL